MEPGVAAPPSDDGELGARRQLQAANIDAGARINRKRSLEDADAAAEHPTKRSREGTPEAGESPPIEVEPTGNGYTVSANDLSEIPSDPPTLPGAPTQSPPTQTAPGQGTRIPDGNAACGPIAVKLTLPMEIDITFSCGGFKTTEHRSFPFVVTANIPVVDIKSGGDVGFGLPANATAGPMSQEADANVTADRSRGASYASPQRVVYDERAPHYFHGPRASPPRAVYKERTPDYAPSTFPGLAPAVDTYHPHVRLNSVPPAPTYAHNACSMLDFDLPSGLYTCPGPVFDAYNPGFHPSFGPHDAIYEGNLNTMRDLDYPPGSYLPPLHTVLEPTLGYNPGLRLPPLRPGFTPRTPDSYPTPVFPPLGPGFTARTPDSYHAPVSPPLHPGFTARTPGYHPGLELPPLRASFTAQTPDSYPAPILPPLDPGSTVRTPGYPITCFTQITPGPTLSPPARSESLVSGYFGSEEKEPITPPSRNPRTMTKNPPKLPRRTARRSPRALRRRVPRSLRAPRSKRALTNAFGQASAGSPFALNNANPAASPFALSSANPAASPFGFKAATPAAASSASTDPTAPVPSSFSNSAFNSAATGSAFSLKGTSGFGFGGLPSGSSFATPLAGTSGKVTSFASPNLPSSLSDPKDKDTAFGAPKTDKAEPAKETDAEPKGDTNDTFVAEKTDERFHAKTGTSSLIGTPRITRPGPANLDTPLLTSKVETGEENETNKFSSKGKLFYFDEGRWKERGVGTFKVNTTTDSDGKLSARMIMRADGALRVTLNSAMFHDMNFGGQGKERPTTRDIFLASNEDGKVGHLLLRLANKEQASELYDVIEEVLQDLAKPVKN
ncbi:unnamed protein product [Penicillium salamii]|uniref:RanBD1 domain-containing protein n=1 Tax=Penicillium salamii TaxID=1612424 RepID=A0A9W4JN84_9EURO|nr:unnamed protein product [Penicillium salamii]CAG8135300.1 unnamed protein product [Penicillium salamii]CAG8170275.1 unnamed protein product [Penicillium salamii]CAG8179421.1 unnamed protein product [Penicillium salamii]CAG8189153.1 unnamed protein product [Penicillium salamii]